MMWVMGSDVTEGRYCNPQNIPLPMERALPQRRIVCIATNSRIVLGKELIGHLLENGIGLEQPHESQQNEQQNDDSYA